MNAVTIDREGMNTITDGSIKGTDYYYSERFNCWIVVDHDGGRIIRANNLVLVTLNNDADQEEGLNQACIGCDLDMPNGLWLLDAEELEDLQERYGDDLEIIATTETE